MLLADLPQEAEMRWPQGKRWDGWSLEVELLAQIVEVSSVAASEKTIREPRKIPRPDRFSETAPPRKASETPPDEWSAGTDRLMAAFTMRMRRG